MRVPRDLPRSEPEHLSVLQGGSRMHYGRLGSSGKCSASRTLFAGVPRFAGGRLGRIGTLECESLLSLCFVELAPRSRPGKPCWPGHSARSKLSHSRTGFLRKYREQDRPETTRKSGHTPACGRSGRESRLSTRAGSFAVLEFGLMGSGGRFGQEPDEVDGL